MDEIWDEAASPVSSMRRLDVFSLDDVILFILSFLSLELEHRMTLFFLNLNLKLHWWCLDAHFRLTGEGMLRVLRESSGDWSPADSLIKWIRSGAVHDVPRFACVHHAWSLETLFLLHIMLRSVVSPLYQPDL